MENEQEDDNEVNDENEDENQARSSRENEHDMEKGKVTYQSALPRREAVSYFEAIVSGLKNGHVEFRQEGEAVAMNVPDHIEIEVKAKKGEKKAKISFEISWKNSDYPEFSIISDKP